MTQTELAKKVGTTQFVIARLEDAEYTGHSLTMLERIAAVCGVGLKLHAEQKPHCRPRSRSRLSEHSPRLPAVCLVAKKTWVQLGSKYCQIRSKTVYHDVEQS